MQQALGGVHRQAGHAERDRFRHPAATLAFMGIEPAMNVVEISPGGGWYTDILASYLEGTLYAAHANPVNARPYVLRHRQGFVDQSSLYPEVYEGVVLVTFDPAEGQLDVPNVSLDAVLTFRNVHSWVNSDSESAAFELFYQALVPGGILGVVEHRGANDMTREATKKSGYMSQQYVMDLASRAGFVLQASSEINANPLDSADHPRGVWSLPPSLAQGDEDRERYLSIGESDRMTLRFVKPDR
jgi:predicted methyltransferase